MLNNVVEREQVLEQYPKLKALHEQSVTYDWDKKDWQEHEPSFDDGMYLIPNHKLMGQEMNPDGEGLMRYRLTDHAYEQLGAKLGVSLYARIKSKNTIPLKMFQAVEAQTAHSGVREAFADFINRLVAVRNGKWLLRCYQGNCRAVLSDRYAIVDNTELLRTLAKALSLQNFKGLRFPSSFLSPDTVRVDVMFKDIDPGDNLAPKPLDGDIAPYGLGVRIKNNEIGNGALSVASLIKRSACDNSIVVDEQSYRGVHIGEGSFLLNNVSLAIGQCLKLSISMMERLLEARTMEIPDFNEELERLCKNEGWTTEFGLTVREGTEGHDTLYGMVNGITFAAQTLEDDEARDAMERLGGKILTSPSKVFGHKVWAKDLVFAER